MSFLTLNGVAVAVTDATRLAPLQFGDRARAFSGALIEGLRTRKENWRARSQPLTQAEAQALRGLVLGQGHSWSFDSDLYADGTGLGPSSSSGATVGAGGKYGSKLTLAATTGQVSYTVSMVNWTVMVWRFESGAWHHYIIRSDGTKWLDGASSGAATSWLVTSSTLLKLANTAGSAQDYDDLVLLPYLLPSSWVAGVYAEMGARAWTATPKLRLAGDIASNLPNAVATVQGNVADSAVVQAQISGAWADNGEVVEFTLEEV